MPSTTIESAAITNTLDDVRKMLDKLAWNYCDHNKQDFEDYQSVANLAYMKAYRSFDPTKEASFSTWAWHCANGYLKRHRSKMAKQYANEKQVAIEREPVRKQRHLYDWVMAELSEDARLVLRLIAESPKELVHCFRYAKRSPKKARYMIRLRMQDEGWPPARVVDAFDEIREVM